jgi:nucleoside-diphosphate-sugar epimerase
MSFAKNYGIRTRRARLHNVFGPLGSYNNGKEKAPAAICRKVAESKNNGTIEIWGTGEQTRSFLYIDECLTGIEKIMNSNYSFPINLGSDQSISINNLVNLVSDIAGKNIKIKNIIGPTGVNHRNSDNKLIKQITGWSPENSLKLGLEKTYNWIESLVWKTQ